MDYPISPPRTSQRLLGMFVVVQILFLFCANILPLLPHGVSDTDEVVDDITIPGRTFNSEILQQTLTLAGLSTRRYGELTGQMQGWSLFAPLVAHQATFLVTELRWNASDSQPERSVQIVSEFHPNNPEHYFHLPQQRCRLINYEFRLSHPMWFQTEKVVQEQPVFWQEWMKTRVSRQWKSLRTYMQFQQRNYATEHPDERPADEIRLSVRCYPIPEPGATGPEVLGPVDRPYVRWRPAVTPKPGELPVEAFDPVEQKYIRIFKTVVEVGHE